MLRRTAATLALTTALVAAGAGAASAHECYITNRSDQGNAGASHSANWYTLQLEELYRSGHQFLGGDPLTDAQVSTALATKSADGKGVDHFFVAYGDAIAGIFFAAQAS
jgi:hypothetical protein